MPEIADSLVVGRNWENDVRVIFSNAAFRVNFPPVSILRGESLPELDAAGEVVERVLMEMMSAPFRANQKVSWTGCFPPAI